MQSCVVNTTFINKKEYVKCLINLRVLNVANTDYYFINDALKRIKSQKILQR